MTYTNLTLGELLSSENQAIRRNAISILKQIQRQNSYKDIDIQTGEIKHYDKETGAELKHCPTCGRK